MEYRQGDLISFSHVWKNSGLEPTDDLTIYVVVRDFDVNKVLEEMNNSNDIVAKDYTFITVAETIAQWMVERGYVKLPVVTRWCVVIEKKIEITFS